MDFVHLQNPDSVLDHSWDLSSEMSGSDVIALREFSVVPAGLTFSGDSASGNVVTVLIGGGVKGHSYRVSLKATLSNGRVIKRMTQILFGDR
jgi:hypothetical protein